MNANLNLTIFLAVKCSVSTTLSVLNSTVNIHLSFFFNLNEEGESNSTYFHAVLVGFHSLKEAEITAHTFTGTL